MSDDDAIEPFSERHQRRSPGPAPEIRAATNKAAADQAAQRERGGYRRTPSEEVKADFDRYQRTPSGAYRNPNGQVVRQPFSARDCIDSFERQGTTLDPWIRELLLEHASEMKPQDVVERLSARSTLLPKQVYRAYADGLGLPFVDLDWISPDSRLLNLLPMQTWRSKRAFPMSLVEGTIEVAQADPLDLSLSVQLEQAKQLRVVRMVGLPQQIDHYLATAVVSAADVQQQLQTITDEEIERISARLQHGDTSGIIPFAERIVQLAQKLRASDIHLEPLEFDMRIRLRIDGALRECLVIGKALATALISYFKVAAQLDITERRLPQDGRIGADEDNQLDMRVSCVPTLFGEKMVIRLLDRELSLLDLDNLMFTERVLTTFRDELRQPNGLILINGPTGSGKTTTLYAALHELADPEVNITTIEDPVEYQLGGINQIQVNKKIDLDFPRALRSILRQDPDIVLIGEIRDGETAEIAIKAALTGHLVLSTVHTNTALEAITRLENMGVELDMLMSALRCSMSQRLLPRLCQDCRRPYKPSPKLCQRLGIEPQHAPLLYESAGCAACNHTGLRGRVGVHAIVAVSDRIRDLVIRSAPRVEIERAAANGGYRPLSYDALVKALLGLIHIDEVLRLHQHSQTRAMELR